MADEAEGDFERVGVFELNVAVHGKQSNRMTQKQNPWVAYNETDQMFVVDTADLPQFSAVPYVYLMTKATEEKFRSRIPPTGPKPTQLETLCSVPFESYDTVIELLKRALQLHSQGRKACIVSEKGVA